MDLQELRHSCSHLLASAVLKLWPDTKLAIGPAIETGFYYDFDFKTQISTKDLPRIEQEMKRIVKNWENFTYETVDKNNAIKEFKGNEYKLELINEFVKDNKKLTIYQSGNFRDLCAGGHCDNPSKQIKHFKLLSIAGAYWRGSEKNKMLTRIYGTCFFTKEELDDHLNQLEEAKKRDHKILGKQLDLFFFSELVGSGLAMWTPKGTLVRNLLDDYVWQLRKEKGYEKVTIPHITKKDLYETSGHWQKFSQELFKIITREKHEFAMKPMNCPHHTQIYNHISRSYRDLPQRYAETTMVYRDEQTGELSGLTRVRSITQDDAHVFCRANQLKDEINAIWDIVNKFYTTFGFNLSVRLSFHDKNNMESYLGTEDQWNSSEKMLEDIAKEMKSKYEIAIGEAAFYGPKIDFIALDSLKRSWQVATIQLDMNMPERFELVCINEKGERERVVMIHAAIMGSIERFISILIEHTSGKLPLWLQPIQIQIIPVSEKHLPFAKTISEYISRFNLRHSIDTSNETLGKKIRKTVLQKIQYVFIIGDKEMNQTSNSKNIDMSSISIRDNLTKEQKQLTLKEILDNLHNLNKSKTMNYA